MRQVLPNPVSTFGSSLVTAPPTPCVPADLMVRPQRDAFTRALCDKLKLVLWEQKLRCNLWGRTVANEYAMGYTPDEIKAGKGWLWDQSGQSTPRSDDTSLCEIISGENTTTPTDDTSPSELGYPGEQAVEQVEKSGDKYREGQDVQTGNEHRELGQEQEYRPEIKQDHREEHLQLPVEQRDRGHAEQYRHELDQERRHQKHGHEQTHGPAHQQGNQGRDGQVDSPGQVLEHSREHGIQHIWDSSNDEIGEQLERGFWAGRLRCRRGRTLNGLEGKQREPRKMKPAEVSGLSRKRDCSAVDPDGPQAKRVRPLP